MKDTSELLAAIERRLKATWATTLIAETAVTADSPAWPNRFPLGHTSSGDLANAFGDIPRIVAGWRTWATANDATLIERIRRVGGSEQTIPTHVEIPDIDVAAQIIGNGWPDKIARGRAHATAIAARFPHQQRPAHLITATTNYNDVDFNLLLNTADWFANSSPEDRAHRTPRQVPVIGLHAKWLNTRHTLVAELAGLDHLGLLPPHPARIHFTYLDTTYLATGARKHDSASVGDPSTSPTHRP